MFIVVVAVVLEQLQFMTLHTRRVEEIEIFLSLLLPTILPIDRLLSKGDGCFQSYPQTYPSEILFGRKVLVKWKL